MKKWLVVLFAAAAMTAWAQDEEGEEGDSSSWKITGEVKSGFEAKFLKEDSFLKPWNDDAGQPFRAGIQLDRAGETSGVSIRLRADGFSESVFNPIGHAYGWIGFLGNKIELSGGLLDNGKWGTLTGFHIDDSLDNHNNLKIEIKPIEGLSLGANLLYADEDGVELKEGWNQPVFGVKYVKDAFGVAAEFVLKSTAYDSIWTKNTASWAKAIQGISIGGAVLETKFGTLFSGYFNTMEDKLTLELDGIFASFDDHSPYEGISSFGVSAQAKFKVSDLLTPGLQVDFGRGGYKLWDNGYGIMDIVLTPKVGVTLNPVIGFGFEVGVSLLDMRSGEGMDAWNSAFGFNVKPSATFTVTPNAKLVLFYNFINLREGYSGDAKPDAVTTQVIQLDMIWTF